MSLRPKVRSVVVHMMCIALIGAFPLATFAQEEPTELDIRLSHQRGTIFVGFDVTSAFTEDFRRRLSGGLTREVLMNIVLVDGRGDIIGERKRLCGLRLDIWDDVVYVQIRDGARVRRRTFPLIEDALRACGVVRDVNLVERALMRRQSGYRVIVRVALNPVSAELMEKSREFMSNPRGTSTSRPRAFFSAVARLFRSETGANADEFVFRSASLTRPPRESR